MKIIFWWGVARFSLLLLGTSSLVTATQAATYYVSPSGSDASSGTLTTPFATLQRAHDVAVAGDTIYLRGGTYTLAAQVNISRDGSSGNLIKVFNYPGEVPILDGIALTNPEHSILRLSGASWWHIKGLELKNAPSMGIWATSSNNNIVEQCVAHHNVRTRSSGGGAGILFDGTSANNLILNNDSHHNGNPVISPNAGSGILVDYTQATGNIIRGNRVWRNNDNGIGMWNSANVLVENNWAWETGYNDSLQPSGGNGVGFKLGGGGTGDGNHIVRNNLAWRNWWTGFDDNGANVPMSVYNNTAYQNAGGGGNNFGFYMAVANVLKNNLSVPTKININGAATNTFNSWNLALTPNDADFVSVDFSGAAGPRNADGSLPTINFLKLAAGSDLIGKGVNVGIPYSGSAPDLGAYEYAATTPPTDTQAPTAPTSLTATTISASQIELSWTASTDNVGVVGYDVYRDGVKIGTTASTTYSSTGLTAATTYSYSVKAFDAAGNTSPPSTSASGTSAAPPAPPPDTTPPTVSIASPTGGTVSNMIPVSVNAADNIGVTRVDLRVNDVIAASTNVAPYQFAWNSTTVSDGPVALTAAAYDAAGNSTTSAAIALSVSNGAAPPPADTTPPTVSIASPTGGNVSGIVTVSVNASDNVGVWVVELRVNDQVVTTSGAAPYQFAWDSAAYPNGLVSLRAVAYDTASNAGASSVVVVNVANGSVPPPPPAGDTTPPTVFIASPTGGDVTGVVSVAVNAFDNVGVWVVELRVNDKQVVATSLTAPYQLEWDTSSYPNGPVALTAVAYDAAGNGGVSSGVTVNVANGAAPPTSDTTPPTVSIASPTGGNVTGVVSVAVNAFGNVGVWIVELRVNNQVVAGSAVAPYQLAWDTSSYPDGPVALTAVAYDTASNAGVSSVVIVNVANGAASPTSDTTPPTVSIASPVL